MIATLTNTLPQPPLEYRLQPARGNPGARSRKPEASRRRVGLPRARSAGFPHAVTNANPGARSPNPGASRRRHRRGISLIEVLVSVGVLSLGLMGIAMVIPAGQVLMADASRADYATACGRAALNDVQIRRWQDPALWVQKWWPSTGVTTYRPAWVAVPPYPGSISDINSGLLYGESYFLDPRFFVHVITPATTTTAAVTNTERDSVRNFPYSPHPEREFALWGSAPRFWPDKARARRVAFPITESFADRLTTWADELIFSLEEDGGRPRQTFKWLDVASLTDRSEDSAFPVLPSDEFTVGNKYPQYPSDQGRLTWSVMITPVVPLTYSGFFTSIDGNNYPRIDPNLIGLWDHDGQPSTLPVPLVNPARIARYEISIVVFNKRDFYCPEASSDSTIDELRTNPDLKAVHERSVYAQIFGGGVGGGDVLLFVPDGDASRPPGYLNVKKDDWIMLKGLDRAGFVGDTTTLGLGRPNRECIPTRPTVCKWYRVIGVDDVETGVSFPNPDDFSNPLTGRQVYVTLAGPDWQVDTTAPNGFDVDDIAEAALVDNVVGVYSTIIDANEL